MRFMTNTPTPPQRATMRAIQKLTATHGYPPSRRELADGAEISVTAMTCRLAALKKKGLVEWAPNIARRVQWTRAGAAVVS